MAPEPRKEPLLQPVNGIVQPPVIPPPNRPGRRTNVLDSLKTMLTAIWKKRWAFHFHHPVDAKALGVPDYHTLIKRPMDLSTIKKRLANKYYYQADEALEDFKLVFENCMLFNKEGTVVHQAGLELKSFFYKRLAMIDMTNEVEVAVKAKASKRKQTSSGGRKYSEPYTPPTRPKRAFPGDTVKTSFPTLRSDTVQDVKPFPLPDIKPFPLPDIKPFSLPDVKPFPLPEVKPFPLPDVKSFPKFGRKFPVLGIKPFPVLKIKQEKLSPVRLPIPPSPSPPPQPPPPPPPPAKPLPPKICYKALDRDIELSYCKAILKIMVKIKNRHITWPFNRADLRDHFSDSDHIPEKDLDWPTLEEHLSSDQFESMDGFVALVRQMFDDGLLCYPLEGLIRSTIKEAISLFDATLGSIKKLVDAKKNLARVMVGEELRKLEVAAEQSGNKYPYLLPPGMIPSKPPAKLPAPHMISYTEVDRDIELSYCKAMLKIMVKKKNRHITWPFNRADLRDHFSDSDHIPEKELDWSILGEYLNSGKFESMDKFIELVRQMFRDGALCYPLEGLIKSTISETVSLFDATQSRIKGLVDSKKVLARVMVGEQIEKLRTQATNPLAPAAPQASINRVKWNNSDSHYASRNYSSDSDV
ncbi:bromodomain-containing protein 4-like [Drosophila serrata]|uniref:bromodomain-containing protein 4-like n=1 Tax=Drosophila serrata TaxID=7274 RepID=UPI000A1D3118|nr:bromodomain-containing protein 4-like [Drosophila serrata]XP_020810124.1 bromodomain-containing protein 4-like [Drosophila serrata]